MKSMALVLVAMLMTMTFVFAAAPGQTAGGDGPGGGAAAGARGGRGGGGMPPIERAKANDLEKPNTPTKAVGADGFIQRWLILDPITAQGVTQNEFQAVVKTQHFPDELTLIPRDAMIVAASGGDLTWHAIDTREFKLNLYHFGPMIGKPTNNVFFWVVTLINCPGEIQEARLAIGSNDASIWWVNGQEVVGIYGDRPAIIDDGVSKRLSLKKGLNVIRGAVHNRSGASDFIARFLDKDDRPISNLVVDLRETAAANLPTIRIKAGADQPLKDSKGVTWAADTGFGGGTTIDRPDLKVTGTDKPEIYRSERYSMSRYTIKMPNGSYLLKLHFSEDYDGIMDPTGRIFSYTVKDGDAASGKVIKEVKDFSPWKAAGAPIQGVRRLGANNGDERADHYRVYPEGRRSADQRDRSAASMIA